jgi:hypothetical protein
LGIKQTLVKIIETIMLVSQTNFWHTYEQLIDSDRKLLNALFKNKLKKIKKLSITEDAQDDTKRIQDILTSPYESNRPESVTPTRASVEAVYNA